MTDTINKVLAAISVLLLLGLPNLSVYAQPACSALASTQLYCEDFESFNGGEFFSQNWLQEADDPLAIGVENGNQYLQDVDHNLFVLHSAVVDHSSENYSISWDMRFSTETFQLPQFVVGDRIDASSLSFLQLINIVKSDEGNYFIQYNVTDASLPIDPSEFTNVRLLFDTKRKLVSIYIDENLLITKEIDDGEGTYPGIGRSDHLFFINFAGRDIDVDNVVVEIMDVSPVPLVLSTTEQTVEVGSPVYFNVNSLPQGDWKLYHGEEKGDNTQRYKEGNGPEEFQLLEIIYHTEGEKTPYLEIDGERTALQVPLSVTCYRGRAINTLENESAEDCDGDGLLNSWEVAGGAYYYQHPIIGEYQRIPLELDQLGNAGVRQKDILIEVSYIESDDPWIVDTESLSMALVRISDLFDEKGINLVFLKGTETFRKDQLPIPCADYANNENSSLSACEDSSTLKMHRVIYGVDAVDTEGFADIPDAAFCRGLWGSFHSKLLAISGGMCRSMKNAYMKTRRHMIVGPGDVFALDFLGSANFTDGSGLANFGQSFVVTNNLEGENLSASIDKLEATILHELGHTLGLLHGGLDNLNCKPNYLSVMNYLFQLNTGARPIDLSHSRLASIAPTSFDESVGLQPADASSDDFVDHRYSFLYGHRTGIEVIPTNLTATDVPLNYNRNFSRSEEAANIELSAKGVEDCDPAAYTASDTLQGHDDWANLVLDIEAATVRINTALGGGSNDGQRFSIFQELEQQRQAVDVDGDGYIGQNDNCPYIANPSQSDDDGDLIGSACDVCPTTIDPDQLDSDSDGLGDACDLLTGASSFTLENGQWTQLGLPLKTGTRTLAQLFGDFLPVDKYNKQWVLFRYSGRVGQYFAVDLNESLDPATGYWAIQATGDDVVISLSAALKEPEFKEDQRCGSANQCIYRQLSEQNSIDDIQWHMISSSLSTPIDAGGIGVTFEENGELKSYSVDSVHGSTFVSPIYVYSEETGYTPITAESKLADWQGGWLGIVGVQTNSGFGLSVSR